MSEAELERAVFTQLAATFRTPMMAARLKELTGIDGAQMSDAMSGNFLDEASNGEKRRLAELLLAGVKLYKDRMELEIKATANGSVHFVVNPGTSIAAGQVLAEIK